MINTEERERESAWEGEEWVCAYVDVMFSERVSHTKPKEQDKTGFLDQFPGQVDRSIIHCEGYNLLQIKQFLFSCTERKKTHTVIYSFNWEC